MTRTQKIILLALSLTVTAATITLAYGISQYTSNRPVHEEYECFE